ncbi:MAG: hypothetical protein LBE12_20920 [Planctomycetaceae bacterium]|nr:hypothetical protein [Planctomycetaceae bacterium]
MRELSRGSQCFAEGLSPVITLAYSPTCPLLLVGNEKPTVYNTMTNPNSTTFRRNVAYLGFN